MAMQQQMGGGLVRAAGGISFGFGSCGHGVVVSTGRPRRRGSRVVVAAAAAAAPVAARPKYRRLRGVAAVVAAPETSRELLDQRVRPGDTAPSQQVVNTTAAAIVREDKFFEIEMKVRDDEIDEYGVVNNAIYASYLHSGRDVLLEKLGISVDYWTSTGNAIALSELNLKYFAPLRSGDRFVVKVKPIQIKGVRIIVEHMIETLPDRKLVLEGRATAICLNKKFRPTPVFPELSASLMEVFSCKLA